MITLTTSDPHDGTLRDLAPDLTPMLDILFIMIVFFMLATGTVFRAMDLTLPSGVEESLAPVQATKQIVLEIHQAHFVIDGKRVKNMSVLKQQLPQQLQAKPEHELIIAGDKAVSIDRLLNLLTFLQSKGIAAAHILMKKENADD